jgi:hypothetical protein
LLSIGALCTIWGDKTNHLAVLRFGKITAVADIVS